MSKQYKIKSRVAMTDEDIEDVLDMHKMMIRQGFKEYYVATYPECKYLRKDGTLSTTTGYGTSNSAWYLNHNDIWEAFKRWKEKTRT